ncbi:MAG: hypothetical protein M3Y58_15210, partial [Chloroflexota bacterium]|nr:hypothetical protein [Chloroflexota bacterium]
GRAAMVRLFLCHIMVRVLPVHRRSLATPGAAPYSYKGSGDQQASSTWNSATEVRNVEAIRDTDAAGQQWVGGMR